MPSCCRHLTIDERCRCDVERICVVCGVEEDRRAVLEQLREDIQERHRVRKREAERAMRGAS